ncbi:MAG: hypothetical protein OEY09_11610 [Gammaproteobacteria bacterium]|nr:hypothetical protein [Gammaproteobacteria bacterium]
MNEHRNTKYCCPACERDILNRAVDRCLYCGASIPVELLFTEKEIQENEQAYKDKIQKIEERKRRQKQTNGWYDDGSSGGYEGW